MDNIIKLNSVYKDYIWGGTKIRDFLRKDTGNMTCIAESWEISTHPAGMSTIAEGQYTGKTLSEYFDIVGWDKLGKYGDKYHQLPILVKYIDAKENLSIQVHPDDSYARTHENDSGKNEMWYIVGAEKGAFIYLGFNRDVTKEEIIQRIAENKLEEVLNRIPVKKGEAYYIPAGTVHAIGKGCLICEIQQTSNVTYRLYDYDRKDKNGFPRELHIEKAVDVLNLSAFDVSSYTARDLNRFGRYFKKMLNKNASCSIIKYEANGDFNYALSDKSVAFVVVFGGRGSIVCGTSTRKVSKGDVFLLSETMIKVIGKCKLIIINL